MKDLHNWYDNLSDTRRVIYGMLISILATVLFLYAVGLTIIFSTPRLRAAAVPTATPTRRAR